MIEIFQYIHLLELIIFLSFFIKEFDKGRFFSLPLVSLSTFFFLYTLPQILSWMFNFEFRNSYVKEENEWLYDLLVSLGFLTLYSGIKIGRFFFLFFYKKKNIEKIVQTYQLKANIVGVIVSIVLYTLAIYGAYMSLMTAGGLFSVIISDRAGGDYLVARTSGGAFTGIFGTILWFVPMATVYIYLYLRRFSYRGLTFIAQVLLVGIPLIVFFLLTARHNMIGFMLTIYYYMLLFKPKIIQKLSVIAIPAVFFLLASIQSIRISSIDDVNFASTTESFIKSFEHKNVTHHMMRVTQEKGYTYFRHTQDAVIFLFPRFLWEEKPITSFLNRTYFPGEAKSGTEISPGILGEGFAALGVIGVFILCLFWGFFIAFVQHKIYTQRDLTRNLLLIAIFAPLSYFSIRSNVFGKHLIGTIIMFVFYYILLFVQLKIKKNNENSI